ncbi:helix-turn-helix domain-containing protein [Pseudomonas sp. CC120222-01a]|uniref:helix-turn-helix domain-containing protein n=1 Tax=Pseudomonas sp. CC120222-01a TaxID=1378075 RepID=UPI00211508FA|nr:helix-turn-helix domain-containing protein [Pseudomonas sp. CC120222-01a]
MKDELAIAIRAVRQMKGLSFEAMSGAATQNSLSLIEGAKIHPSLPTLLKLAQSLDISVLTLLALSLGVRDGNSPKDQLHSALKEVENFIKADGLLLIEGQIKNGVMVKRPRGTTADAERVQAVLDLKRQGKTQAAIARELGLPPTTVRRYWLRDS